MPDTLTYSENDSYTQYRSSVPSVAFLTFAESFVSSLLMPLQTSYLYTRYRMRARWTIDDSFYEWTAPLLDASAAYAAKPFVELADIVSLGTIVESGWRAT